MSLSDESQRWVVKCKVCNDVHDVRYACRRSTMAKKVSDHDIISRPPTLKGDDGGEKGIVPVEHKQPEPEPTSFAGAELSPEGHMSDVVTGGPEADADDAFLGRQVKALLHGYKKRGEGTTDTLQRLIRERDEAIYTLSSGRK